jgi:hypothetical protein
MGVNAFISHRGSDALLAERLATELKNSGVDVWLDNWEINLGDSIVERMQQGLSGSSYLILCYSADGVTAPWIGREWMSALARQLDGHAVKILPVRLSGGQPPEILADIKYADLVRDWDAGVAQLRRALV